MSRDILTDDLDLKQAIAGFSYLAYIYLNKDSDSGSGGGGGSGSSRSPEDSLEEARRIMDKYK